MDERDSEEQNSALWYTTPTPNWILDKLMCHISGSAFKVVMRIVRHTYGWTEDNGSRKLRDWISHSLLCRYTGLHSQAIASAIEELESNNIIEVTDLNGNPIPKHRRRGKNLWYRVRKLTEIMEDNISDIHSGSSVEIPSNISEFQNSIIINTKERIIKENVYENLSSKKSNPNVNTVPIPSVKHNSLQSNNPAKLVSTDF